MYIKVDESKISNEQLVAISEILGIPRLNVVFNIHYEACKKEIECVIENSMDYESAEKFKKENEDVVIRWTDMLYHSSDYQWDRLYEKAEDIVDLELDDIDI
jgi:hypothetical protein